MDLDQQSIQQWFDNHREPFLELLERAVRFESPSNDKSLVDRFVREVDEWLTEDGWRTIWHHQQAVGDLLEARLGDTEERPGILMLAHADTVWEPGESDRFPWRIAEGSAYGPGAYDMKAGLVMGIFAIRAIKDLGLSLGVPVTLLVTTDEEIGSWDSRPIIEALARRQRAVFCLEPAIADTYALKTRRKGVSEYTVRVFGRAAHSGSAPERGISAINELAELIRQVNSLAKPELGTTVNVGRIWGGTRSNVVAEQAGMVMDVRAMTAAEAQRVDREVRQARPSRPEITLEVTGGIERWPFERTDAVASLYGWAKDHAQHLGFGLPEGTTGGASDGSLTAALGIPTLDGLGPAGSGSHGRNEHIVIELTLQRAALLTCLLVDSNNLRV